MEVRFVCFVISLLVMTNKIYLLIDLSWTDFIIQLFLYSFKKSFLIELSFHLILQSTSCDARTKLEAQAYVAWIHGSLHFELQLWKSAMENLKKAQ